MAPGHATDGITAVVAGDAGFGKGLIAALERRAHRTVLLPAVDDSADAAAALGAVTGVAAVVHVCGDDTALASGPLVATDADGWDAACERVMWRAVTTLQAAHSLFSRRGGGRVVVVTATAGVSGAAHAVPLLAAVEGVRALAKSAARQWGSLRISVNCVSVPLDLLAPSHADLTSFLPPAAIARDDPLDDVAGAIEFLGGPGAHGISGATLVVDGGAAMTP